MLDQASQYGVKVMFTLTNNWKTFDSKYNVRPFAGPCCLKSILPADSLFTMFCHTSHKSLSTIGAERQAAHAAHSVFRCMMTAPEALQVVFLMGTLATSRGEN